MRRRRDMDEALWDGWEMRVGVRVGVGVALALGVGVAPLGAQSPIGIAAVDSAAVARAAWSRAAQADDFAVSRREIDRASAAWPTQPAYLWAKAMIAAKAGDTAVTMAALTRYAGLELGRDLREAVDLKFLSKMPSFDALAAKHDAHRRPVVRSTVVARMAEADFWPEGVDHDPTDGSFYVAGIRHGTIARIDAQGRVTKLWPDDSLRLGAVLGVRVDARRGTLWATTSAIPQNATFQPSDSALAAILQIDLATRRIRKTWRLPLVQGGHVLGDLAVDSSGAVWISDSVQPFLFRLRAGVDTLETFHSPLFRSLQGVAVADGVVFVADYSHGLLRLDVKTGDVSRLSDAPASTSLGCDGLAWYRGSLIAVQNGVAPPRIMRFHLSVDRRAIERAEVLDRNSEIADEPTIGTIVGDRFVYVANSQWEKHDDGGRPRPGVSLTPLVLLGVPIR